MLLHNEKIKLMWKFSQILYNSDSFNPITDCVIFKSFWTKLLLAFALPLILTSSHVYQRTLELLV